MDTKQTYEQHPRRRRPKSGQPAAKRKRPVSAVQTGRKTAARPRRTAASAQRKVARQQSASRRTRAYRQRSPERSQQPSRPTPSVVYTPARTFSRNRLVLQLAIIVAVVLAMTFGISIFFKVETITVSGAQKYSAWTVKEASGIEIGDNLLSFGKAKASGKITAELPYVESVRIGIKLPDTVNIEIKELDVAYAIKDNSKLWWLVTSEGRVVDQVDSATAGEYTQVLGVALDMPSAGQQGVAWEEPDPTVSVSTETTQQDTAMETPQTVFAHDRLNAALSILQYLEDNSIIGQVASVDVTDLGNIELWWNAQQYQVKLGDTTQLAHKIELMDKAIKKLQDYDSGVLDISFYLLEDQVIYDAFE